MVAKTDLNCWDFFNCSQEDKQKCPAYLEGRGKDCWFVENRNTQVINSGVGTFEGTKKCWDCEFFHIMHFGRI